MKSKAMTIGVMGILVFSSLFGFIEFGNTNVSGTDVSGSISTDTTWTLASSPYFVVGDILVENGVNLTIEPGVEVKFDGYYNIFVEGDLYSVGTNSNRIIFTSNITTPAPDDWDSIQINSTGWGSIQFCDISYGNNGIDLSSSSHNILSFNNITSNSWRGINAFASSNNIISYNNISNNNFGIGMTLSPLSVITKNNVSSNNIFGIGFSGSSNNDVINNSVWDNMLGMSISSSSTNNITGNNIFSNTGNGIELWDSSNINVSENEIYSNIGKGIYLLMSSSSNNISKNNITDNSDGIYLEGASSNNMINNNNISLSKVHGIMILTSPNNNIKNNTLVQNNGGITLWGSAEYNNITFNTITSGTSHGVHLYLSSNNNLTENHLMNNSGDGFHVQQSSDNLFMSNNITQYHDYGMNFYQTSIRNTIIKNNISLSDMYGLYFNSFSSDNNIIGNNIFSNDHDALLIKSSNNELRENIVSNNEYGIHIKSGLNSVIKSNNISENDFHGIWLENFCNDSIISYNNVTLNRNWSAIRIQQSANCQIIQNDVFENDGGISLTDFSTNCTVVDNKVFSNEWGGIGITYSHNNTITNNSVFLNNWTGISLGSAWYNHVLTNEVFSNAGDGIRIGWSALYDSHNNTVMSNNVSDNLHGIKLQTSVEDNIISNNMTSNEMNGICVWDSINSEIEYNNVIQNKNNGFDVAGSSYIKVFNNHIQYNENIGTLLWRSIDCNVSGNEFIDDGIVIWGIEKPQFNTHSISKNNLISGRPIYYYVNSSDTIIDAIDAGEIILANCTNFTIRNLLINNSDCGLELGFTTNITISNNDIHSQDYSGIYVAHSSLNNIIINNVSDSYYGIRLSDSSSNNIYHNNILNNSIQGSDNRNDNSWDDGYPSGGNYWSDYGGIDNFKGPLQDIPGMDGIGDTNYTIDLDSKDNYPLLGPYPDRWLTLDYGWNLVSIPAIQSTTAILSVLASLEGQYDAVQFYNNTDGNDHWKHYHISKPSQLNDLIENNHNQGFWIHITNPSGTIFRYDGVEPSINQTIDLHVGWNMVGYPSLTKYNRSEGLNSLQFGPEIDAIQWFDASTKTWHFLEEGDHFVSGRGYFIHSKVDTTWEVPL